MNKKAIAWGLSLLVVAALGMLGGAQPEQAAAYVLHGDSWAQSSITYKVNPNFPDPSAGTPAQQIAAIQRAASEWTSAGQIPFQFLYGGTTTTTLVAPTDGTNAVFYKNADGGGALAVATWSAFQNGDLFGFDIEFYDQGGGLDFVWALDPAGLQFDIESVAVHEFGHAIGLGHSAVAGATMFPSVTAGTVANRTLHADDIAGVQALYGVQASGAPVVTDITPDFAWILGGDRIRLTGTEFSGGDPQQVTFDGIPASGVTVIDRNTIECDLPMGLLSGWVSVGVSHAQGAVDAGPIFFNQSLRELSPLAPGQTGQVEMLFPADAGLAFEAAPALGFFSGIAVSDFGDPGDTRVIPLDDDPLFQDQRDGLHDDIFVGFTGNLDGGGYAVLDIALPNEPYLSGYVICFSSVTYDPAFPSGIKNIGNAAALLIQ